MWSEREDSPLELLIHHNLYIAGTFGEETQRSVTQFAMISLNVLFGRFLKAEGSECFLEFLGLVELGQDAVASVIETDEEVDDLEDDKLVLVEFLLVHSQLLNLLLDSFQRVVLLHVVVGGKQREEREASLDNKALPEILKCAFR